jgi:hypothetical protein
MHTAKPLIPEPRLSEVEIATAKLKKYKLVLMKFQQN